MSFDDDQDLKIPLNPKYVFSNKIGAVTKEYLVNSGVTL